MRETSTVTEAAKKHFQTVYNQRTVLASTVLRHHLGIFIQAETLKLKEISQTKSIQRLIIEKASNL